MEIWKDIDGYIGLYQVSNYGRVRSLDRCYGFLGGVKHIKGVILKFKKEKTGYVRVQLHKDGIRKFYSVHRLVAQAFIPNTDNKPCIDHINTIRNDNRVDNLRWCDMKDNQNNPLTKEHKINSSHSKAIVQYTLDGEFVAEYSSANRASKEAGYNRREITHCCNGGRFRKGIWENCNRVGEYIWRYK